MAMRAPEESPVRPLARSRGSSYRRPRPARDSWSGRPEGPAPWSAAAETPRPGWRWLSMASGALPRGWPPVPAPAGACPRADAQAA
eukprot:10141677-Alexandrium_andersonii.AAC.1